MPETTQYKTDQTADVAAIDTHVGVKVKARRILLGMTQGQLGQAIGLTFQQVQKYERGVNHMAINRLVDISKALSVSVDYFFEGMPGIGKGKKPGHGFADNDQDEFSGAGNPFTQRDILELIRAYSSIKDPALKKQLLEMAKIMAKP